MKKKGILVVFCLMMVTCLLTSCGFVTLGTTPALDDAVVSNGGISVIKGDYLYFVDSYLDETTLASGDNDYNKIETCAIYRTRLDEGQLVLDEDGVLAEMELVVPKVVGFSNTNLFIYDNYIYYGTPNMKYDKDGELRTDLIDFCRAKLDGSGVEILYTTENYEDTASHSFCKIDDKIYLVVFDGSDIIKVGISTYAQSAVSLVSDVSSVLIPQSSSYSYVASYTVSGLEGYVYYVRSLTADDGFFSTSDKGNVLGRVNIKTGAISELKDGQTTYEMLSIQSHYLYVYKTVNSNKTLWAKNFNGLDIQVTATSEYSDVVALDNYNNVNRGVIVSYDSQTVWVKNYLPAGDNSQFLLDNTITIKYISQNFVYYLDGTSIYRINLDDNEVELVVSDEDMDSTYIDFGQDGFIYYFATYTGDSESALYLNRVNLGDKILPEDPTDEDAETDLGYTIELVGILADEHIVTEEE